MGHYFIYYYFTLLRFFKAKYLLSHSHTHYINKNLC